jgi:hypothetical protein
VVSTYAASVIASASRESRGGAFVATMRLKVRATYNNGIAI